MPWITIILLSLILLMQYPLWLGKGSLPHLQNIEQTLQMQKQKNAELKLRNAGMEAEIQDLKSGYDAIEERARSELGMIKPNETLYQYLTPPNNKSIVITPASTHHKHTLPVESATSTQPKTTDDLPLHDDQDSQTIQQQDTAPTNNDLHNKD